MAHSTAPATNAKPARRSTALEYAVIAVIAVGLAFLLQAFIVKPYRIPSVSMVPTLQEKDRILANRFLFHFRRPERGDILVFRWPKDRKVTFVKRLIGLPGDTLSLEDGRVYVNGRRLDEPYLATSGGEPVPTKPLMGPAGSTMTPAWSLAKPYTVPQGNYFMMGDNRLQSLDSREWGPVPEDDLIGKAFFVYWPPDRLGIP